MNNEIPLTQFTDYAVLNPYWFIEHIQTKLNESDLPGLTNDRILAISVTGEHPFIKLISSALANNGVVVDSGIIPAIAVTEGNEAESLTTMGHGIRGNFEITQEFLDKIKSFPIAVRYKEGLISDNQIMKIETALNSEPSKPALECEQYRYYIDDIAHISLWTHSINERLILGNLLRSILYGLRIELVAAGAHDIKITNDKGLFNSDFGRSLFGEEVQIRFKNYFRVIKVFDRIPMRYKFDENGEPDVTVRGSFKARGTTDPYVEV